MNLPYQFLIALRYLKSKKKRRGLSFSVLISICGVAVGVMALVVVLSVMSGFHEDLQKKILGVNSHVIVLNYKGFIENYQEISAKLKSEQNIVSDSPFVMGQVMVSYGKKAHGVFLRGIEPSLEAKTTEVLKYLKEPPIEDLNTQRELPWIIIGRELSFILGVLPGDVVNVISPVGEIGPLGMLPKARPFRVVAIFEVGMFEYDTNLVLTDLRAAQTFFNISKGVTGISLRLDDIYKASEVRDKISKKLTFPFYAKDWTQMNRNLFAALKLEKFAMFIILTLIILVASFNIVSTLMMNVMEKQKEIAILKSIGATNRSIMLIFILQGLVIGIIGTTFGIIGGYALGSLIDSYEIIKLPADVYYLSKLPVKMKMLDFIIVATSAIFISFISTIYPSYQASRLQPVELLRYE
ncbi:MAG: lipoprotein-releasing ABC transporter permease subunit [Thermodesulfovibrionales bacterium]|nr:lipoprotein-releasing ABC transporter permease subunit [Thermodesulfovibrionales bacterium]